MYTMIMLDIHDMNEKDKLFFFLDGLSREVAIELQRRRVQNLVDAVTVAERLSDYDIGFPASMKAQGSVSHSSGGKNGYSGKSSKFRSRGGSYELAPQTPSLSSSKGSNSGGRLKLSCVICREPHKFVKCP